MHVVPVEWSPEHELEKVMLITQDIGQKHALENLANTDGLTGLFNERYFNSILHKRSFKSSLSYFSIWIWTILNLLMTPMVMTWEISF